MARIARPWRRGRGDDGAALIEAAIILPVLFTIILGIIDFSGALLTYSTTSDAVRAGGRQGSVGGSDGFSDQQTLVKMANESGAFGKGEIDYIIIWHATTTGEQPPAGCAISGATPNITSQGVSDGGNDAKGACNVYVRPSDVGGAFDQALDRVAGKDHTYFFGCTGQSDPLKAQKVDCNWPGKNRRVTTTVRTNPSPNPPDYLGVAMKVTHKYYTKVIAASQTVTDSVVALIEPQGYSAT